MSTNGRETALVKKEETSKMSSKCEHFILKCDKVKKKCYSQESSSKYSSSDDSQVDVDRPLNTTGAHIMT